MNSDSGEGGGYLTEEDIMQLHNLDDFCHI